MTDLIVIDRRGNTIHKYIADDHPATVVVREGGTMIAKRQHADVKGAVSRLLTAIEWGI